MIVIYAGPTLSAEKARQVIPGVDYRPPIVRGDLNSLPKGTRVVGIVDGVFFNETAVGHKEIIAVMKKGVTVAGSSSMGALRAAELADFGMIGVGRVYECYRSGRITDDDEVAVTFNPATGEQISQPLVNIRYQLKAAEGKGLITTEERRSLVAMIGGMYYPERTYPTIVELATVGGILSDSQGDILLQYVREHPVNLKAEDAFMLLEKIKEISSPG
ncbi:MAG TPA: TfuA-related McrA-glycine thioamidation protein [Methanocella sp.]|nr:TfuA-related McrA-glycine thioamidation protein [Methanocella sp.]